jgi:2',3'-cyclic-nucleotide 2'-phosphodiesterase (5'-nucleotidase family)
MVHGIDIIVGGHSHNRTGEPLKEGQTLIVSAGAHGSHVGRLDLRLRDGRIAGYQRQLIVVDRDSLPAHPAVAAQLEAAAQPHRATLDEPIGEARARLVRAQTLAGPEPEKRDQLSPIDVLFANILRAHVRADIALLPGVGYGVAIGPGRITAADLRNLIPHGSKIVTVSLTGAQVKDILEQAVHNVYTDRLSEKVGGMIQVSGLRFKYDPARARGERVLDVLIGDSPLDRSRTYKVGTNSLLADGGHNYRTFLAAASRQEGPEQYEVVKEWFGKVGPVTPPSTDAIEKAGGPHTERSFRRTGRSGP